MPRSRRAYSVRQISPGDRRLLAEFALAIDATAHEREIASLHELTSLLFDQVIVPGADEESAGFVALENTAGGDRIIGAAAYAPATTEGVRFAVAVAPGFREEQVGRTLMSMLLRHARRLGVASITGEMQWSNRPMHGLAASIGFGIDTVPGDRNLRRLSLRLK